MATMTSMNTTYTPYVDLAGNLTWVMSPNDFPAPFVGKQWYEGNSTWVDWFNPNATSYWTSQLNRYNNMLNFDGIWIDLNEPLNFCNGECGYYPRLNTTSFTPGG
jgi:alpha-glucosidase (family GH31 glycosyl hydrolase)